MSLPVVSLALLVVAQLDSETTPLHPRIQEYVIARTAEFDEIADDRKSQLNKIAQYIRGRASAGQPARLTFICTHNSRRSHLSQIWAATAAAWYGVSDFESFSGGTEATAFNPRAISALKRAGFDVSARDTNGNPKYQVRFRDDAPPMECFSKVYCDDPNPKGDFCAVMTCAQADKSCPVVEGAALRIALPFEDPKAFDGTPEEAEKYDERCRQIAREMLYVFSQVKD